MTDDRQNVANTFDARASNYSKNQWHRAYAQGLVAHSSISAGNRVLDAGVGTAFAALAAAERVGLSGHVVGVDISPRMLDQAHEVVQAAGCKNVQLQLADACDLPQFPAASFDAVICAAALLYMPVSRALNEWYRVLKPSGFVGFSTMRAGFPQAARLFRDCAAEFGVRLLDPSAELGTEAASHTALELAGFVDVVVVPDHVPLSNADLALAWESNVRSAAHAEVLTLPPADLEALHDRFEHALWARTTDSGFTVAEVLYAYGRK
jgi:ubiquinone/menaquinone biosynthesis C-methylase UbiE